MEFDWADPVATGFAIIAVLATVLLAIFWLLDWATRDLKKW